MARTKRFNTYEEFLEYFPNASYGRYMDYLVDIKNTIVRIDTFKGKYIWKYD